MNKKILSIFALIMALSFAVSCSNSDTTGTGGNNNNTPTALDIKGDDKYASQDTTDLFFVTSDGSALTTDTLTLSLSGTDYADDKLTSGTDKNKIKVTIKTVKGLTEAEVTAANPSGQAGKTTKVDLSSLSASDFELDLTSGVKFKVASASTATVAGKADGADKFGLILVTLTFHDNNEVKTDKEISFYAGLYR